MKMLIEENKYPIIPKTWLMKQEPDSIPSSVSLQINKFLNIGLTNYPKYDTIAVDVKFIDLLA